MSKRNNGFGRLKGCSRWVLAAVAMAAAARFADDPKMRDVDWNNALLADSAPCGGLSREQTKGLPTWSLDAVAAAAARRYGTQSVRYANVLAEIERRRAKRMLSSVKGGVA